MVRRILSTLCFLLGIGIILLLATPTVLLPLYQLYAAPVACVDATPDNLHDGYCSGGYYVERLITYSTWWQTQPTHTVGRALYYAEGVMESVAASKGYDTSGVELVSLLSPSTVGWTFHIRVPTLPGWIKVMDVDAAALHHYEPHILYADSPIEFSYALAVKTGLIDWTDERGERFFDAEICLSLHPERDCAGTPVDYRDWFLSIVRYQS
jgi:hypothetical protein